jgi:NADPH-dependent 7-cyano-7-deazaguanine reductase QueF
MDERKQEGELHLLGGSTVYKQDYAPEVLEAFTNKHQGNDYWVRFNCPEFTSLCPITGQPDFATIHIDYIPDVWPGIGEAWSQGRLGLTSDQKMSRKMAGAKCNR